MTGKTIQRRDQDGGESTLQQTFGIPNLAQAPA
jgi:hypothetical protein